MPRLYGNEWKHKIRAERNKLRQELLNERRALGAARRNLRLLNAAFAEQNAQIESLKRQLLGAITEAEKDITDAVIKRYSKSLRGDGDVAAAGTA